MARAQIRYNNEPQDIHSFTERRNYWTHILLNLVEVLFEEKREAVFSSEGKKIATGRFPATGSIRENVKLI
jgi:hypothetical protein